MSIAGEEFSREWGAGLPWGGVWGRPICGVRAYPAGGLLSDCPTHSGLASLKGDRWQVQRDEEVFEEVLNHPDLVVQAMVALEQM